MTSMVFFTSSFMNGNSSSRALRRSASVLETIMRRSRNSGLSEPSP